MPIGVTGDFVPLGSFKVIDGKDVGGALTGSAVSSSGLLFASTTYDSDGAFSNVVVADTASGRFYVTSSYGAGGSTGDAFPFTGSAAISGSLAVEGDTGAITAVSLSADYISASVNLIAPQITSLTSSMVHVTASLTSLTSSVVALTASQVLQDSQITALTSSMVHVTASLTSLTSSVVALTASAVLQGSQILASTGSGTIVITNITNSGTVANTVLTGSFTGSFTGDGSNLTGVEVFPFTGSAAISGSLSVEGNTGAITASGDISASGTGSFGMITSDKLVSHTGDVNTGLQFASDTVIIEGADEIIGRFSTANIQLGVREFVGGFKGTQITGSLHVSGSTSGITSSGDISASSGTITALNYQNTGTVANTDLTGSFTGSFTGPLTGTSSHAETASFATTASHALNTGQTAAAGSDQEIQYNDGGSFGGNAGLKFDDSLDASLFVAGPITASLISASGNISASSLHINGIATNTINVSSGVGDVAINATSTDANCMVRVSDNNTATSNVIGFVATGDDSIIRNDEGNLKVKVNNNQKVALELSQAGDLSLTGSITGLNFVNTGTVANTKLTGSFTGSFTGNYTGPQITSLTSSIVALTASQVLQDSQITSLTSSMVHVTASLTSLTSSVVALTASAVLQGSQILASTGSGTIVTANITNTGTVANSNLTGSFTGSFTGDGSNLTGVDGFPFTGSAAISGTLSVDGPVGHITASGNISASGNLYISGITSSGNISSTGNSFTMTNAISPTIRLKDTTNDFFVDLKQANDFGIIIDGHPSQDFYISTNEYDGVTETDAAMFMDGGDGMLSFNDASVQISVGGHITSSGNISSSGHVNADTYQHRGSEFVSSSGTTFIFGAGTGIDLKAGATGVASMASLTANTFAPFTSSTLLNSCSVSETHLTGSFTGSFTGDGSNLTGVDGFPFTGSAAISGSLVVNGPDSRLASRTASFGTGLASTTTNPAGTPLFVLGNISASGDLKGDELVIHSITDANLASTQFSINTNGLATFDSLQIGGTVNLNGSSNNYGNGAGDKHTFTGNITASNDITASGDVFANEFVLQDEAVLSSAGTTFSIGGSSRKSTYRGLSHLFSTAITSSTHISSSGGTITGLNYQNTGTVANTKLTGSFTGSFTGDGSSLTGVAGFPFTGSAAISGSLSINGPVGHITASGNISSSGATFGNVNLGNATSTDGTITLNTGSQGTTALGFASGQIVKFGGTSGVIAGAVVVLKSTGKWEYANGTSTAASTGSLGMVLGTNPTSDGVLLNGFTKIKILVNGDDGAIGDPIYLGTANGRGDMTPPSGTGNVVRIIGHLISGSTDGGHAMMHFNPSPDFILHE